MLLPKVNVLFLCTGNSCRSQMAEGWARTLRSADVEPYSAGTAPSKLDPLAVRCMDEAGVDISRQRSKSVAELDGIEFDLVVTVCSGARESCPIFPGAARVVHQGFDDPPALARGVESDGEALDHYRRVRDEIREFVTRMRVPKTNDLPGAAGRENGGGLE